MFCHRIAIYEGDVGEFPGGNGAEITVQLHKSDPGNVPSLDSGEYNGFDDREVPTGVAG